MTSDPHSTDGRATAISKRVGRLRVPLFAIGILLAMLGAVAFVTIMESKSDSHSVAPLERAGSVTKAAAAEPRDETPFHETHLVFALGSRAPVIKTDRDAQSGYEVKLAPKPGSGEEFEATVTGPSGMSRTLSVRDVGGGWANLFGDGDPIMFCVAKYWPDFAMKDGNPVSISDQPHNPVVLVEITGPTKLLPAPAR